MTVLSARALAIPLAIAGFILSGASGSAQWLTQPTPGIPRSADGKANLSAAAPRNADGKPDLSGLWEGAPKYDSDFTPSVALPWAREQARTREANPASDSWATLCLPPGPMISFTGPLRIIQTRDTIAILYEVPNNFRQIFMDGRVLPKDPNPTWQGTRWADGTATPSWWTRLDSTTSRWSGVRATRTQKRYE